MGNTSLELAPFFFPVRVSADFMGCDPHFRVHSDRILRIAAQGLGAWHRLVHFPNDPAQVLEQIIDTIVLLADTSEDFGQWEATRSAGRPDLADRVTRALFDSLSDVVGWNIYYGIHGNLG